MAGVIEKTVKENMTKEATYLAQHDEAKLRLKQVYEMPDRDADAIIRSLRENNGRVSKILVRRYPSLFEEPEIAAEVIEAVTSALDGRVMEDVVGRKDSDSEKLNALKR